MRKQTKLVAVMSAAALLAIGASMTSFAATRGWVEENGVWMYLDSDGDAITEDWRRSGTQYFWLDENGEMATEALIEDDDDRYYVDANGARVINQWRQVDNDEGWSNQYDDEEPEMIWYYFGSNGKAVTGKKTVNGKTYFFDEDGQMFYKWYTYSKDGSDEKYYYLGEENEGWAVTGWQWLELKEDLQDTERYENDEYWFHFKSNGEMRYQNDSAKEEEPKRAYINGYYYGFDENGVMVDGWRPAPGTATSTKNTYYTEEIGNQPKGWVLTHTYADWDDKDDDPEWFYLNSKGKPFNVGANWSDDGKSTAVSDAKAIKLTEGDNEDKKPDSDDGRYTGVSARYIKKKTYLFGSDGVMLSGVIRILPNEDGEGAHRVGGSGSELKPGIYYFNKTGGSANGQMETGKVTVNYDGENYYYNLRKKNTPNGMVGMAYTNAIVDNCLYDMNGVRINADESRELYDIGASDDFDRAITNDKDEVIFTLAEARAADGVIVSSSGKVKKSGTVTIDGTKYKIGSTAKLKDYLAEME